MPMQPARVQDGFRWCPSAEERVDWRRKIRREVAWFLVVKCVALTLLWWLFFSPLHQRHIDGDVTSRQFGVPAGAEEMKGDRSD